MAKPMKDTVNVALDNLRPEANFPLMQFAKKHLNIDMEKVLKDKIVQWARKYVFQNKDWKIANGALSSLDSAIAYVQNAIGKSNPKMARKFFNYIKDKYAKIIVDKYMELHKEKFVEKTVKFGKSHILQKIFSQFDKRHIRLSRSDFDKLKRLLSQFIENIDDNRQSVTNFAQLRTFMNTLSNQVQNIVLEKIMQRKSINEDLTKRFHSTVVAADIQEKINATALNVIRRAQIQEIYQYDGLIERVLPASVRGLHDVSRSVIEGIALKGDKVKDEDLLNFEMSTNARDNPTYRFGHTGPSNRSSTLLSNIAMYFASNHGLRNGTPTNTWIMIYESTKGINTTELVDKNVPWTELEFATSQLKPGRFLGAVKFELDAKNTDKNNISFVATEGFVHPKVHEGKYRKEGVEGDIKHFLEIAKYFDKPAGTKKPDMKYKLPRDVKKVSQERSFFQTIFDKVGLSGSETEYRREREEQRKFVQNESPAQKEKRLEKEKSQLKFWHQFSQKVSPRNVREMLPTCKEHVFEMQASQRKRVEGELREMLRAKPQRGR